MKQYIIYLIAITLTTSCVTQQRCLEKFPPKTIIKDSIVYRDTTIYKEKIVYKDSLINIPGETIHDTIKFQFKNGVLVPIFDEKHGNVADLDIKTINNQLIITSSCKEKDILIKKQKETIETLQKQVDFKVNTSSKVQTLEVKYVPEFYKWCLWILIAQVVSGILYLIYKIKKV